MALKIRLARGGAKKRPFYPIVIAEDSSPRDGRFVERVGSYNPILATGHADRVVLNGERISYWLSVGAKPTDRVLKFLRAANLGSADLLGEQKPNNNPKQSAPKKKAQARAKEQAEKAAALADKSA